MKTVIATFFGTAGELKKEVDAVLGLKLEVSHMGESAVTLKKLLFAGYMTCQMCKGSGYNSLPYGADDSVEVVCVVCDGSGLIEPMPF